MISNKKILVPTRSVKAIDYFSLSQWLCSGAQK